MRIIAGEFRGRRLKSPKGMLTRPTLDRIRETIFNVLYNYSIRNRVVLDLFAGTGALGLEALSRGASCLTAVDQSTANLIMENANLCKVSERVNVIKRKIKDIGQYLAGKKYDLVFSDPPYNKGLTNLALNILVEYNLLNDKAIIVLEYDNSENIEAPDTFKLLKEQIFGYTKVSYYMYEQPREESSCV